MKKKVEYDEFMDADCIEVCDLLNSYPGVETFESCCGHFKHNYNIFFRCNDFTTLGKLFRCVNRNYSSGQFEILVDGTDVHPCNCFWLRSKEVFKNQEEMDEALNDLKENLKFYLNCSEDLEKYFATNGGHQNENRSAFIVTLSIYLGSDPFTGEQMGDTDMLTVCDTLEDAQEFIKHSIDITAKANQKDFPKEQITYEVDWPDFFKGRCAYVRWKGIEEDGSEKKWFYDYGIIERYVHKSNEYEDKSE